MRTIMLSVVAASIALACAATAEADSPWYVSANVGGFFRENLTENTSFFVLKAPQLNAPGTLKFSYDPGTTENIAVGYRFKNYLRIEAELGYAEYTGGNVNPFTASPLFPRFNGSTFTRSSGADYSRFSGTLNVFHDFAPISKRFTPYVGLGVGGAESSKSAGHFVSSNGGSLTGRSGSSSSVLGLVEGGINITLSNHWSVTPAYRYTRTFDAAQTPAHVAKIGLRYAF